MKDIDYDQSWDDWDEQQSPRADENDFDTVVESALTRRGFMGRVLAFGSGAAVMGSGLLSGTSAQAAGASRFPFTPIDIATDYTVHVPQGYNWERLVSWSDPLMSDAAPFDEATGGDLASSDKVFGENTDGMELFEFQGHQLIAVNHEYANPKLNLAANEGGVPASADDVLKLQNL